MKYFFLFLNSIFFLSCANPGPQPRMAQGEALGTAYHIKYYSEDEIPFQEALDSIFLAINHSMSTYQSDSDISRLNSGDTLVQVDTLFQKVLKFSQKVYKESGGYFDPTVGDLVNMYGFGPEKALAKIDSSTVDSLMNFVGLDKVKLSISGKITKDFPQVYLDFNAIAKGYTLDVIGIYLDQQQVDDYLIELGGELLAKGKNLEKESAWKVGIDSPEENEDHRDLRAVLELKDRAMATSGNYRKFRTDTLNGEKYVHTINPLTGFPEKSKLLSASVLAENCALADAYATTFMALGLEKSQELLRKLDGVDVYFLYAEDNEVKAWTTKGFENVLVKD